MDIPFRGLSLQEDCHYLLYPSVGILSDTTYELHFGEAGKPTNSLSTDPPGDVRFCFKGLFGVLIGVLIGVPAPLR